MSKGRLPTYFISHGGGPWPWLMDQLPGDWAKLHDSLTALPRDLGVTPRAVLAVSGHWEAPAFTVQTNPHPPMLYDYGGFPEFTYRIEYPAPGAPEVAARVAELLGDSGIAVRSDAERGFDHGVFAPFAVVYPNADVPIVQLSIRQDYDPTAHLDVGRALAPLRDEGVLIVGSGLSFHNMRLMGAAGAEPSAEFERWLTATLVDGPTAARATALEHWSTAPSARTSHPREDHLIPLLIAVGAAEDEPGHRVYHEPDAMGSITSASYRFGDIRTSAAA